MTKIELDPKNLLGFKIIATDGSTMKLSSPKIGDKGCTVVEVAHAGPASASGNEVPKT